MTDARLHPRQAAYAAGALYASMEAIVYGFY
jgi:hypothetical protein